MGWDIPVITNMKDQRGSGISWVFLGSHGPDVQIKMMKVNTRKIVDQVRYVIGSAKAPQTCRYSSIDCSPSSLSRSRGPVFIRTYGYQLHLDFRRDGSYLPVIHYSVRSTGEGEFQGEK